MMKIIDTHLEDEKVINNLKFFPQKSFLMLVIGTVYSGKSYFCYQLVNSIYANMFHYVYLMSVNNEYPYQIPPSNICNSFDLDWFHKKMSNLKMANDQKIETKEKPKIYDCLLIMDDFASNLKKMKQNQIMDLFLKRRHFDDRTINGKTKHFINLSIIVTSQYYRLIPQEIRNQLTSLVFFNIPNLEKIKIFVELIKSNIKDKQWIAILNKEFELAHTCIQIRNDITDSNKIVTIRPSQNSMSYEIQPLSLQASSASL